MISSQESKEGCESADVEGEDGKPVNEEKAERIEEAQSVEIVTPQPTEKAKPPLPTLSKKLLLLFAFTCFAVVGNIYYAQPLLVLMGNDFHKSHSAMGLVTTCCQVGYALGLLLITPLGDMLPRRRILLTLGFLVSGSLLVTGFSVSYIMMCITSVVMGMLTVMPQIIVPLAADLADPKVAGKTIGFVFSGLLLGVLLSRTISGWVALGLGWRSVYWGASIIMTCTTTLLFFTLPTVPVTSTLTYKELIKSIWDLLRKNPLLWQAGILGATVFGSFSCFWTTITFRLSSSPYNYDSGIIGLFSLIGAAGVIGSPLGGFLVDKKGNRFTQGIALALIVGTMVILTFLDKYIEALIIAMFFYDVGVQTSQVCNQQRIYKLLPKSKSRANSIYMVCMFSGGAIGSAVGSWAYGRFGWRGSGVTSLILLGIAVVAFFAFPAKYVSIPNITPPKKEIDKEPLDAEAQVKSDGKDVEESDGKGAEESDGKDVEDMRSIPLAEL